MMTLPSNAGSNNTSSFSLSLNMATLLDAGDIKQGNCGKHDCQIVLMAFLQKVMFDAEDDDLSARNFST